MASRSDQLHSHQFTLQRVVGALAMRDPDPVSSPMRRIGGALFASVMFAALAVAAVGVYGVLRPGTGDSWRQGNAMIIEKETGARFVYRDNVLYPVLNYTSALLILNSPQPNAVQVSRSQLVGVTRGTPLGISGAPDPLPGPAQLVTEPWALCSRPPATAPGASPSGVESVLRVGAAPAAEAFGQRGMLVSDPSGGLHLLWNGRRFALTQPDLALTVLAWNRNSASPVSAALLNAIPAGADIGRFSVPRSDRPSGVDGFKLGEVFVFRNQSGNQVYGVATADGAAEITAVQAGLLLADPGNGGGQAREIDQARYVAARKAASLIPTGDNAPPANAPEQLRPGARAGVCATFTAGAPNPSFGVVATLAPAPGEVRGRRTAGDPAVVVDWMAVPPGRGAVVESVTAPGAAGALAVVSDLGLRFAVPSRDVLAVLGYPTVTPQRLPAALVALVPSGRALDPAAAVLPAS